MPFRKYLETRELLEEPIEARRIAYRANRYILRDGALYKKASSHPLLKCINFLETQAVLKEVHSGVCGNHLNARSLCYKMLRQGYFWPVELSRSVKRISTGHSLIKCGFCLKPEKNFGLIPV